MGQADGTMIAKHFARIHQPRNAGVDGQATFLGGEGRKVVNEAFSDLTLPPNPNLWHSHHIDGLNDRKPVICNL
jgi:hypothetical protein